MEVTIRSFHSWNRVKTNPGIREKVKDDCLSGSQNIGFAPVGCFNQYAIAFKKKTRIYDYAVNLNSLNIKGLPCPCCGNTMIPLREFEKVFREDFLPDSTSELIDILQPYEQYMHQTEKHIFKLIKKIYKKDSNNQTFQDILTKFNSDALKKLTKHQLTIFSNIDKLSDGLSLTSAEKIKKITGKERRSISKNNGLYNFKRKAFIKKLLDIMKDFSEENKAKEIYQEAIKLKNATNDTNSFIVKYSRRGPKEICRRLISPSISTIEHTEAYSSFEDKTAANEMKRLILECKKCNNEKDIDTIPEQIKNHPEMIQNAPKYFSVFIEKMNTEEIPPSYIPDFIIGAAQNMHQLSYGLIKIDLSKLETKQPALLPSNLSSVGFSKPQLVYAK